MTMNVTKLDGRYKYHNRGFRYRVDFKIGPRPYNDRDLLWGRWRDTLAWAEATYGKEIEWYTANGFTHRRYNDNYRVETPANKWYRQLYLRKEEDITMLLLMVGA